MKLGSNNITSVVITVCILLMLSGCYTLLKHPPAADAPDEGDFGRCTDCHSGYYHPGPHELYYPDPWWDYYALPWWYDNIVVITDDGEVPAKRSIWRRELDSRGERLGTKLTRPDIPGTGTNRMESEETGSEETEEKVKSRKIQKRSPEREGSDRRGTRTERNSKARERKEADGAKDSENRDTEQEKKGGKGEKSDPKKRNLR